MFILMSSLNLCIICFQTDKVRCSAGHHPAIIKIHRFCTLLASSVEIDTSYQAEQTACDVSKPTVCLFESGA
jgi:hypothetical protein